MKNKFAAFSGCIILVSLISCGKTNSNASSNIPSTTVNYAGNFMKTDSSTTSANGKVSVVFNPSTLTLSYTITWHSLSSEPIAMHFHDNGPVIVSITGYPVATDQTFSGTAKFTSTQASDLASGYIYVMIHTTKYSGGEIMAPLSKQ